MSDRDDDPLVRLLERHHPAPPLDADRLWRRVSDARSKRMSGRARLRAMADRPATWLAAAAVTLILAAGMSRAEVRTALASEVIAPVRSWTSGSVDAVRDWLSPGPPAGPPITVDPPTVPQYVAIYPSESLRVIIEHCQPEGLIEVRPHASDLAYLEITGGQSRELLGRRGGDLVVHNRSDSKASYRLRVPDRVRYLVIRIDTSSVIVPTGVPDPRGWVLHLQPADAASRTVGHCRG